MRESSGSTNIEMTLLKALRVLKLFGIPQYVCDGVAVQERGYPRFTDPKSEGEIVISGSEDAPLLYP